MVKGSRNQNRKKPNQGINQSIVESQPIKADEQFQKAVEKQPLEVDVPVEQQQNVTTENQPIVVGEQSHTSICALCEVDDGGWVVCCDDCQRWFHFKCVQIKTIGKDDDWSCDECKAKGTVKKALCHSNARNSQNKGEPTIDGNENPSGTINPVNLSTQSSVLQSTTVNSANKNIKNPVVDPIMIHSDSQNTRKVTLSNNDESLSLHELDTPSQRHSISIDADKITQHDGQSLTSDTYVEGRRKQGGMIGWDRDIMSKALSSTMTQQPQLTGPEPPPRLEDDTDSHDRNGQLMLTREKIKSLEKGMVIRKPLSSGTGSIASKTTSSSQRRIAIELQRLEEERDLQARLDEEELALKMEAFRLKDKRERKFLDEKFRVIEKEGSTKSKSGCPSQSQYTQSTAQSKRTSTWIQDQQRQVLRSDVAPQQLDANQFGDKINRFIQNISIPIDEDEGEQIWRKATERYESRDPMTQPTNTDRLRSELPPNENQVVESSDPRTQVFNPKAQTFIPRAQLRNQMLNPNHQKSEPISTGKPCGLNPKIQMFEPNPVRQEPKLKMGGIYESTNPRTQLPNPNHQRSSENENQDRQSLGHEPTSSGGRIFRFSYLGAQVAPSDPVLSDPKFRTDQVYESTNPRVQLSNRDHQRCGESADQNQPKFRTDKVYESTNPRVQLSNRDHQRYGESADQNQLPLLPQSYVYKSAPQCQQQTFMNRSQDDQYDVDQSNIHKPSPYSNDWKSDQSSKENNKGNHGHSGFGFDRLTTNQIAARHTVAKKLPHFYGDPAEWPAFIQKYESTTVKCGLDNTENLDRLFECLKGNARDIVKSQLTMPECVPSIIETLAQKFGRPETVIKSLLTEIRAEQPIKADKLEILSNFGYKVQNLCKSIQRQKMDFYLYNPEVVQEIVDKLPHQTKIDWARHSCDIPQVTLITLSDWLMKLSRSLNKITTPEVTPHSERKQDKRFENVKGGFVNAHDGNPKFGNKPKCEICSKDCKNIGVCPKFKGLTVDERWKSIYNNRKVCRRCLQVHGRQCSSSKECGVSGCVAKHHTLLHNDEKARTKSTTGTLNKHENCNAHRGQSVFYKIIPVTLKHKGKSVTTYAYMDDGSGLTLIEKDLVDELGLTGKPESLCLRWTSGTIRHEDDSMRVMLSISGKDEEERIYRLRDARTVVSLDLPKQNINRESLTKNYPYLSKVPFQEFNAKPRILIGLDNIKLGISRESVEGHWHEPVVSKTLLGWVVHGPNGSSSNSKNHHMQHHVMSISCGECPCQSEKDHELHRQIEEFFSLENFGTRALTSSVESKDVQRAKRIMEETIVRKNGRFEIGLLWRYDDVQLPNSYPMAVKRLECQEKRMFANPALMENINNQIRDFIAKGYVRKLTPKEIDTNDPRTCYLPLFHHLDQKKPDKVRLVWDAAAKVKGVSLNSMLLSGPDNLTALIDVLRRFREKCIAIGGDIQEMYHQVMIRKEDQNSQRFLWRNGNNQIAPDVYVMQVMTFGATCSPSCAQFIKNQNASDFEAEFPKAAKVIINNHYVDDWLDCQHTVEEAIQLAKDVTHVHQQGGFKLRKLISNSPKVLSTMGENGDQNSKDLNINTVPGVQRVLGMWWDSQIDCFTYSLKYTKLNKEVLMGTRAPTKRELLKTLMSIYDPLGLIAFFLVYLKMLLQETWKFELDWDVPIPDELLQRWNRWIKVLPKVEEAKIPRLYSRKISPGTAKSIELHVFVDASENAYCAVSYLRIQDEDGVECTLLGAKTKVSPLKPILTIPRKELLAAVLGTRLAKSMTKSLTIPINKTTFWSDSRDVLCWIRSTTRKYRQFVAFRVGEILETSTESSWRWVPGKLNVADEGTKWCNLPSFSQDSRWFKGPEFLWKDQSLWPEDLGKGETTSEEIHVHFAHSKVEQPSRIDPTRFSQWWTMLKAQALSTRYLNKLVAKVRGKSLTGNPKSSELKDAEYTLYKLAQSEFFSEEIQTLRDTKEQFGDKSCVTKSSSIYKCSPYLEEDGLLRVRGRIDNISHAMFDTKRPIILPRQHIITDLIVKDYHVRYLHQNHKTVLNELSQKYFIPKLRVVLNQVIAKCQVCKNNRAKPVVPMMGDLPKARLSPGLRPFTYTGVYYFGPMYVRVNRGTQKRWGVLLTCLTVRAIHIEIAPSLSADSCILCIRNFTAIRGTPREFYSDNGTNFKSADTQLSRELKKLDLERLESEFTRTYSKWIFIPPSSPNMAGSWERLIRSVKTNLYHVMPMRTPPEELLRSYLMEVSNLINSRPLTNVEIGSSEDEALTPNHFLLGSSNGIKAPGEFPYEEQSLTTMWRRSQELTNMFWKRWMKEYLPTLTRRSKWFPKAKPIEVGDVVLIVDERNPRNCYPKGIIEEVRPDKSGQVRSAVVRTARGTLIRPANKLAVLDVAEKQDIKGVRPTDDQVTKCPNGEENVKNIGNTDTRFDTDRITIRDGNTSEVSKERKPLQIKRSKRIAARKQINRVAIVHPNKSSI